MLKSCRPYRTFWPWGSKVVDPIAQSGPGAPNVLTLSQIVRLKSLLKGSPPGWDQNRPDFSFLHNTFCLRLRAWRNLVFWHQPEPIFVDVNEDRAENK